MSLLHDSVDLGPESDGLSQRFRGATIDAALTEARSSLGPDVQILEANRIRRGGVGGFFATELGVEITVRAPGEHQRDFGDAHRLRAADDLDAEYLDTTRLPHREPTSSAGAQRPHSVDQRVAEYVGPDSTVRGIAESTRPPEPTRIDDLVDATSDRERIAHQPVDRSFAEHLARHIREAPTDQPGNRRPNRSLPPRAESPLPTRLPASEGRVAAGESESARSETAITVVDPPTCGCAADSVTETHRATDDRAPGADRGLPDDAAEQHRTTVAATEPPGAPSTAPAMRTIRPRRRRSATSDAVERRPSDLAADAVGRLVEQLSGVAPVDGSRMRSLSRLSVSVTTSDGCVIEMAAELGGADHG